MMQKTGHAIQDFTRPDRGFRDGVCCLPGILVILLVLLCSVPARADGLSQTAAALAPAPGRLLVAQRSLRGPWFARTVVYILQHNDQGTSGVIINRPLGHSAADLLPWTTDSAVGDYPVFLGGPVHQQAMLILFRGKYEYAPALNVAGDVYVSNSTSMLEHLISEQKPAHRMRLFAGQAGWAPGQLQGELDRNDWYVTEGDHEALFSETVNGLWERLINRFDPQGILVELPRELHYLRRDTAM